MKAIDILMEEHQLILKVLQSLEVCADRLNDGDDNGKSDLVRFAEFFREFADRCHHGKEEDILFEEMAQHGFRRETPPLAVMYHEHDLGREQVRTMREAGETGEWNDATRTMAVNAAETFVTLLRDHIFKEDNILYPLSVRHLPPSLMEDMTGRFEEFNTAKMGTGEINKLHKIAGELIEKYA